MTLLIDPVTHRSDRYGWAGWVHWETSGAHFYAWEVPRALLQRGHLHVQGVRSRRGRRLHSGVLRRPRGRGAGLLTMAREPDPSDAARRQLAGARPARRDRALRGVRVVVAGPQRRIGVPRRACRLPGGLRQHRGAVGQGIRALRGGQPVPVRRRPSAPGPGGDDAGPGAVIGGLQEPGRPRADLGGHRRRPLRRRGPDPRAGADVGCRHLGRGPRVPGQGRQRARQPGAVPGRDHAGPARGCRLAGRHLRRPGVAHDPLEAADDVRRVPRDRSLVPTSGLRPASRRGAGSATPKNAWAAPTRTCERCSSTARGSSRRFGPSTSRGP